MPGRPTLWGTTPRFLEQFGLKALSDLPRKEELVTAETGPALPLPGVAAHAGPPSAPSEAEGQPAAADEPADAPEAAGVPPETAPTAGQPDAPATDSISGATP